MLQHQNPFALSFLALFLTFFYHCSATQFTVGDSGGWVLPPYPDYYKNWSNSHFMRTGDSLEFNFDEQYYNLIQVSRSEYDHCTALEPVRIFNISPVIIPLKERGVYFFICSISNYCSIGQKVIISVHENSPRNPPTPSPSQVPAISPQLSPSPHSMSNPPASTPGNVPPPPPPVPDSTHQGGKSNAVALVCGTSFSFRGLSSLLATIFGFWVM